MKCRTKTFNEYHLGLIGTGGGPPILSLMENYIVLYWTENVTAHQKDTIRN